MRIVSGVIKIINTEDLGNAVIEVCHQQANPSSYYGEMNAKETYKYASSKVRKLNRDYGRAKFKMAIHRYFGLYAA